MIAVLILCRSLLQPIQLILTLLSQSGGSDLLKSIVGDAFNKLKRQLAMSYGTDDDPFSNTVARFGKIARNYFLCIFNLDIFNLDIFNLDIFNLDIFNLDIFNLDFIDGCTPVTTVIPSPNGDPNLDFAFPWPETDLSQIITLRY